MTVNAGTHVMNSVQGSACTGTGDPETRRFVRWLSENGASISSLRIDCHQGLRGLRSTRPISCGETVIHIPRHLMITMELAQSSPIGQLAAEQGIVLTLYGQLAAFLLDNRHAGSFWKPFIDVLPTEYPDHPFLFSEEELAWLRGSSLLRKLTEHGSWTMYEWQRINACLPQERQFSLRDFCFAQCTVASRTYALKIDGAISAGMVPFADMLNHSFQGNADWNMDASEGFRITASSDIAAGMPVYETYGVKSNVSLFYAYGFCLDENPHNETELDFPELPEAHPFYPYTAKIGTVRDGMRFFTVQASYKTAAARAVISFLRLLHLKCSPGMERVTADQATNYEIIPVSRENEMAAMTMLADACRRALDRYETSADQDDALLLDSRLPRKLHYAVIVRQGEKRVLEYFHNFSGLALAVLTKPFSDMACHAEPGQPFAEYFAYVLLHLRKREELATAKER